MSLKVKLTSLIMTFMLLASLLVVGVFAVKSTSFNVGGDIKFTVKGIEATITRDSVAGFSTTDGKVVGDADGNILSNITLNNDMSAKAVEEEFAPWSGLNLAFEEGVTTATIVLTITNTVEGENPDNYLDISASASATTINNAKISVTNSTGGTTALLQQNESETFTITFEVIDAAYSASLNGFVVNFNLQKKTLEDFPTLSADMTYQTFRFRTIEGETGLSIEDIGLEEFMSTEDFTALKTTGAVEIPEYVKYAGTTYPVTKIAEGGFMGCVNLTSITIPNTVTSIGEFAFGYCSELTSITIPDGVTSIGESAFDSCSGLTSIVVESGNSVYDSRNNCNALIETATNTLIQGCNTTVIPDGVTSIGAWAFYYCTGLTSITIPNSVTFIGESAFHGCSGLTSITIPNSVTFIGKAAFSHCSGLTSITIPNSVTFIGSSAFNGCDGLTSITIPNSVTSIGSYAFQRCAGLTSVTIGSGVTSIGTTAFEGCTGLTSITIPNSVTSIGNSAFDGCDSLTYNKINETDEGKYLGNTTNPYLYLAGTRTRTLTEYTIHEDCKFIGSKAFSGCTNLTSVTIPDSVTSIGDHAFYRCSSLTYNKISETDEGKYLGNVTNPYLYLADTETSTLTEYAIHEDCKFIGSEAFSGCTNLTSITIPASVTSIGYGAFDGCSSLKTVNYRGTQEQWDVIVIGESNDELNNADLVVGYTKEQKKKDN